MKYYCNLQKLCSILISFKLNVFLWWQSWIFSSLQCHMILLNSELLNLLLITHFLLLSMSKTVVLLKGISCLSSQTLCVLTWTLCIWQFKRNKTWNYCLVLTCHVTAAFCAHAPDVCAQKTIYIRNLNWYGFKTHDFSVIGMIIKNKHVFFSRVSEVRAVKA